jgi:prepilin-type processing-associated H-X9-DG protein
LRAFSLIELVVVIGIIATATALLVPAISSVRGHVGDVTCENNLRQLLMALEHYSLDNDGSMPYGFFYVGSGPPSWGPPPGGNNEFISWASELNQYLGDPKGYAPAFRCPVALQQVPPHLISYVMNLIVAVSPLYEVQIGQPPRAQTKPPSIHLMRSEGTALIWDTPLKPNLQDRVGYLVGADIDSQRFWEGAQYPQYRYFSPHDPFGQIPPGVLGNNQPVRLNVGSSLYRNIDPPETASFPYQGNLRFRHAKQTQCNVAFSDGSVRKFTAVVNPDDTVASHDAIRRFFMINWPPGVPPNPAIPSFQDEPMILPSPYRSPFSSHLDSQKR